MSRFGLIFLIAGFLILVIKSSGAWDRIKDSFKPKKDLKGVNWDTFNKYDKKT